MIYESKGISKTETIVKVISAFIFLALALYFYNMADRMKYSTASLSYYLQTGGSFSEGISMFGNLGLAFAVFHAVTIVLYKISWTKIDETTITASYLGRSEKYLISEIRSVRTFGNHVFINGTSAGIRLIVDNPKKVKGILEGMIRKTV